MDPRSSKRQRNDATAEVDATAGGIPVASNEKPIVRDETYYREKGDCVILIDNVLFKVHRFLLERDMSAFSNMFSLPQENAGSPANSDENPLVLYDDVDDFRALCWIMYALPTEHSQQHALETANIQKLVSLYLISHKYHFEAHETFARDLLSKHCLTLSSDPASEYNYFNECPESLLQTVLRVAVLTEHTLQPHPLSPRLQEVWTNRLKQTNGPIAFALGVADALGLRDFMAVLYYFELTKMTPVPLQNSLAYTHPIADLAPRHLLALYRGSWSLRHYWLNAREISPKHDFACDHIPEFYVGHSCPEVWIECWGRVGGDERGEPFDPLEELSKLQHDIAQYKARTRYITPCAENAIFDMIDELKSSLADHFFGSCV